MTDTDTDHTDDLHDDDSQGEKPYLSYSRMSTVFKCGYIYKFRWEDKMILPPKGAMVIGSGVDDTANQDLTEKMETGHLLPDEAIPDLAATATRARIDAEGLRVTEEEKSIGFSKLKDQAVDTAVALANLHHKEVAPTINPTAIQRPFRVEVKGNSRDLVGYIDIQEDGPAGGVVRDTKTTARAPSKDKKTGRYLSVDRDLQLSLYALAVKVNDGEIPGKLTLDYLVKTKTPKVVIAQTTRTEDDLRVALERIHIATRIIESGLYTPADPGSWICSRKWCGYFDLCPYGSGRRKSFGGFKV